MMKASEGEFSTQASDKSSELDGWTELLVKRKKFLDEIKALSKELNEVKEQNNKDRRELSAVLKDGKEKYQFIENSAELLRFWSHYVEEERVVLKAVKDSIRFLKISDIPSMYPLTHGYLYTIENKVIKLGPTKVVQISFLSSLKNVPNLPDSVGSDSKKSFTNKVDWYGGSLHAKQELSNIVFGYSQEFSEESFDVPISDELFKVKVKDCLKTWSDEESGSERETLLWFFRANTISEEERKNLWKLRIGNSLMITKEHYEILKYRLSHEGVKKNIDKLISDDIIRTIPDYRQSEAGIAMFDDIKTLLCLWQLYRPDIGYVQGMSYLIVMLFYYFEGFECFVLFANLMITKDVLHRSYTFDMDYVTQVD